MNNERIKEIVTTMIDQIKKHHNLNVTHVPIFTIWLDEKGVIHCTGNIEDKKIKIICAKIADSFTIENNMN